eukprot:gene11103-14901_t
MNNKIEQEFLNAVKLHSQFEELFLSIRGYPNNYEISSRGRVRNIKTGRILKPNLSTAGYKNVDLYKNGKVKTTQIHQLVALTFISNILHKPCVDHVDNNKLNNNISNLRWVSHSQNNMNKTKLCNNTSGVTGVSWNKRANKWTAKINIDGIKKHLGYFKSIEAAKQVRIRAVNLLFKEYANQSTNK